MPHVTEFLVQDHIAPLRREAQQNALVNRARASAPRREHTIARLVGRLLGAVTARARGAQPGPQVDRPGRPFAARGLD